MNNELLDKLIARRKRLQAEFKNIKVFSSKNQEKISYINGFNEAFRIVQSYFREKLNKKCPVCGGRGEHTCGFGVSEGKPFHFPIYSNGGEPPVNT